MMVGDGLSKGFHASSCSLPFLASSGSPTARPSPTGCRIESKGVSPLASRADAPYFCCDKSKQKRLCREGARFAGSLDSRSLREFPNSLQSLMLLPLRHAETLLPQRPASLGAFQAEGTHRERHHGRYAPRSRFIDYRGFDQSRWIPHRVRDDGKERGTAAFDGWSSTCPAVSAAEKRRGGWKKTKRCLSAAPQARSEFFSSHPHRASQGTRAAGGDVRASGFGYFCRHKSTSQKACEAGVRNAFVRVLLAANSPMLRAGVAERGRPR